MSKKIKVLVIPTEIYSRVVGYYRPVHVWNDGKQDEFNNRKMLNSKTEPENFLSKVKDKL